MVSIFRIGGLALIVFGIVCLFWGLDLADTFSNRFMKEMAGDYPDETKKYIFGGIGMIVVGVGCLIYSFRRRNVL